MSNETAALIERMRKQRELKVTVGKFVFFARRPNDVEALELHQEESTFAAIAQRAVIGWENVVENDVVGGGGNSPLSFDEKLWREWCADRPDFWKPISERVLEAYELHAKEIEAAGKN